MQASQVSISQTTNEIVKDIDGNIYHTVKIGKQTWMLENLKVKRYRNGDGIAHVVDNKTWDHLKTGAWCYYNNDSTHNELVGKLYNFYAVKDIRQIAPEGWHVPSNAEWDTLISYLGGIKVAGGKMKEAGTKNWKSPNIAATNVSGFTGLPGGFRYEYGEFFYFGQNGYWWNDTVDKKDDEKVRILDFIYESLIENFPDKNYGISIRCIKD